MKQVALSFLITCLVTFPAASHAAIVFQDSFENDATGYNNPDSSSTPPYGNPVGSGDNGTPIDQVITASGSGFSGADGAQFMELDFSGSDAGNRISPLHPVGTFTPYTTYTLSDLMAQNFGGSSSPGNLFTGTISIEDATTSTVLNSYTINFANAPDGNFHPYHVSFDTASEPSVYGDKIQIILSGNSMAGSFQGIEYDKVLLTSAVDAPEPSTYVLFGLGFALTILTLRSRSLSRTGGNSPRSCD